MKTIIKEIHSSDRVCDDLCEVILKYLSLEDRLKLECVSKQFQRTRHSSRNVQFNCGSHYLKEMFSNIDQNYICSKSFRNLNRIIHWPKLRFFEYEIEPIPNELIEVIIKNCNNLTHIQFGK